jgi:hypothetical protein
MSPTGTLGCYPLPVYRSGACPTDPSRREGTCERSGRRQPPGSYKRRGTGGGRRHTPRSHEVDLDVHIGVVDVHGDVSSPPLLVVGTQAPGAA